MPTVNVREPIFSNTFSSRGHNIFGINGVADVSDGVTFADTDRILAAGVSSVIGPLTSNGGPTLTHEPNKDGPAVDAGSNDFVAPGVETDQRGPGFSRVVGTCDVGAVETRAAVDECPKDLVLKDGEARTQATFKAAATLTAGPNYRVMTGAALTLLAGQRVQLKPNFRVEHGATLRLAANLDEGCNETTALTPSAQEEALDPAAADALLDVAPRRTLPPMATSALSESRLTWSELPDGLRDRLSAHGASVRDVQQDAAAQIVTFATDAALLVEDDNDHSDVYAYWTEADQLQVISVGTDGLAGNAPSEQPRLHGFSWQVVYRSTATSLVAGPQNGHFQLYLSDLGAGTTARLTQTSDAHPGNADSGQALVAGDWVIFRTDATNLSGAGAGLYRQHIFHQTRQPVGLDEWGMPDPMADRPAADATGSNIAYQRPDESGKTHIYLTDAIKAERLSLEKDARYGVLDHCCTAVSPDGNYFAYREQGEQGAAWVHVCNRTHCSYDRLTWPEADGLQAQAPQFNADGSALLWLNPEQAPGLPEILYSVDNPLVRRERGSM